MRTQQRLKLQYNKKPKTIIEIVCDICLRDKYKLKDGDIVEIELAS